MVAPVRRIFFFIIAIGYMTALWAANGNNDEEVWMALKGGGHVVLLRHAVTVPGIGDPPGFVLNDCATQRNLSKKGRDDASRIGQAFLSRGIPVSRVLSSRWCRCLETARIAFGDVEPSPMLDSMFGGLEQENARKIREVRAAIALLKSTGNLVLVTHNRNIHALTGISPVSGEMVVVAPAGAQEFKIVGRIKVPGM